MNIEWNILIIYKKNMIYNIDIKDSIRERINEISNYIYKFTFSIESTKKVYNHIYKEIFSLKIFPNRYPKFNNEFRVLTISKKYRVFFKVDEENMIVEVSRIFFSSEDYFEKFKD